MTDKDILEEAKSHHGVPVSFTQGNPESVIIEVKKVVYQWLISEVERLRKELIMTPLNQPNDEHKLREEIRGLTKKLEEVKKERDYWKDQESARQELVALNGDTAVDYFNNWNESLVKIKKLEAENAKLWGKVEEVKVKMKDCPPHYQKVFQEHFWELLA